MKAILKLMLMLLSLLVITSNAFAVTVTLTASQDTWIWGSYGLNKGGPYGNDGKLSTNPIFQSYYKYDQRFLIQFSQEQLASVIPPNSEITKATVDLYPHSFYMFPGYPNLVMNIGAFAITSEWAEDVMYTERPSFGTQFDSQQITAYAGTTSNHPPEQWFSWDVTLLVKQWISGEATNYGVAFWGTSGDLGYKNFRSSEYWRGNGPRLTITYELIIDQDNDGIPDAEDNCPEIANPDQEDWPDGDQIGDACDPDDDNDGINDINDNCPIYQNPEQTDSDYDNIGDACDLTFNTNSVVDALETIAELVLMF